MTGTGILNQDQARAWRAFQRMSVSLATQIHRNLMMETGLSLPDYEVLSALAEAPTGVLRAFELGAEIQWEKSRLSHHMKRMEARGLVERVVCESDGRGLWVSLTPAGRLAIEKAAPVHQEDVRQLMVDALTADQLASLAEISEKVLAGIPSNQDPCD
ncbi:MAG: MarR family winged helix-turn-helix transcriptional regulator [Acidimicrobiia bacterium]